MKVLILSQYYSPEPLGKPHELARGLLHKGHQVTVLTGFPNYPSGTIHSGYRIRPWRIQIMDGVRVIRLPLYPDHSRSKLRRVLNYASFAITASLLGPLLSGKADVMYVFHPPLSIGIAAGVISLVRRLPFVYSVGDLWPEMAVAAGMMKEGKLYAVLKRLERFIYSRASKVAVVSPGMIESLANDGVIRRKLHVLTDWADESIYRPVPADISLADQFGMAGKFNVVFGGQLGMLQRLDTVIEAAEILRTNEGIQWTIVGDGVERIRLEESVAHKQLSNVRFLGNLPAHAMPGIYSLADVLLIHLSAQPIFRVSIPGKTYPYMACGKPILAAVNGVTADLIRSSQCGITCDPENPEALSRSVLELFNMSKDERDQMGDNARSVFLSCYSRTKVLEKHEELLLEIAKSQS